MARWQEPRPGKSFPSRNRIVLLPDAIRDLERLPVEHRLSVLDTLEGEPDLVPGCADAFTVDGVRYYSVPVSSELNALLRPLRPHESRDYVAQDVISDTPEPAYVVFGLERATPEPSA